MRAQAWDVGRVVWLLRRQRGWSRLKLSEAADLSPSTVQRIEAGGHNIEADSLDRLAAAFRIPVSELFALVGHLDEHGALPRPGGPLPIDSPSASATLPASTQQERPTHTGQEVDDVEFSEEERHVHRLLHAALHLSGKAVLEQVTSLIGRALSGGAARPKAARRAGAGKRSKQSHG